MSNYESEWSHCDEKIEHAGAPNPRADQATDRSGVLQAKNVKMAMAHEHMFTDFCGPDQDAYMDVNWSNKIGAAVENAEVLRGQGVNLVIEWTNIGIGRNVVALRSVSRQSEIHFVCPTGIHKDLKSPILAGVPVATMAKHFVSELATGIDGTGIRAGLVKTSCNESGATRIENGILRAAAIAAKETGAALGFHGPEAKTTRNVLKIMEKEGFNIDRFVWAHAQVPTLDDNKRLADRGVFLQYDAIGAHIDQFFGGPVSDDTMLERLAQMVDGGYENQLMLSTDAAACINPPTLQYDRNNAYLYRYFEDKLKQRIGKHRTRKILRDNVIVAFRQPSKL